MTKILLFLAISLAVIHGGTSTKVGRTHEEVSFIDSADDSEMIREKIKTDAETFKKIKEMIMKNKLASSTIKAETIEVVTEAVTTSSTPEVTSGVPLSSTVKIEETKVEEVPETTVEVTTAKPEIMSSSTIRQLAFVIPEETGEEIDEGEIDVEATTLALSVDDRFILTVPCAGGKKKVNGECRKIIQS